MIRDAPLCVALILISAWLIRALAAAADELGGDRRPVSALGRGRPRLLR